MDCDILKAGVLVQTNDQVNDPESTKGYLVKPRYIECRKSGLKGQVQSYVPGHGGDVWFVRHEDGSVGAYGFHELEKLEVA